MDLTDCNEYSEFGFQCKSTFQALSNDQAAAQNSQAYDNMYAAGAILIVGGVGYFVMRKRRTASIDLNEEENSNFEMMSDAGVRA